MPSKELLEIEWDAKADCEQKEEGTSSQNVSRIPALLSRTTINSRRQPPVAFSTQHDSMKIKLDLVKITLLILILNCRLHDCTAAYDCPVRASRQYQSGKPSWKCFNAANVEFGLNIGISWPVSVQSVKLP